MAGEIQVDEYMEMDGMVEQQIKTNVEFYERVTYLTSLNASLLLIKEGITDTKHAYNSIVDPTGKLPALDFESGEIGMGILVAFRLLGETLKDSQDYAKDDFRKIHRIGEPPISITEIDGIDITKIWGEERELIVPITDNLELRNIVSLEELDELRQNEARAVAAQIGQDGITKEQYAEYMKTINQSGMFPPISAEPIFE